MIFDEYSYLTAGDPMPPVHFTAVENGPGLSNMKGQIVLLNFFIISCKHCKHMLEYFQEEIWPEFQHTENQLLIIGRGHTPEEISDFRNRGNYILPFAADPERLNYDKFAEKKVPRNYLFDSHERLIYQTRGFDLDQMSTLRMVMLDLNSE
jgi:peroxiredoxin